MEIKVATMEAEIKNLGSRFKDFLDDVRALRGTWTGVTIALVMLIFAVAGFTMSTFNNVTDTQMVLMKEQVEIKRDMKVITAELIKINSSMEAISKRDDKK